MRYEKNLRDFINSLPASSIRFLYFKNDSDNKTWRPMLTQTARKWENSAYYNGTIYVIRGVRDDGYCYLYKEGCIRYNIQVDGMNRVKGYEPDRSYASVCGNATVQAQWGDHLTIGVENENGVWMLMTHKTGYYPIKNGLTYKAKRYYCDIELTAHPPNEKTGCVFDGTPNGQTLAVYDRVCKDKDALPMLRSVHRVVTKGSGDGRKAYLSKSKKIGGVEGVYKGDGFTDEFIEFVRKWRVEPVAEKNRFLSEVTLVDDLESEHVLLMFHENYADDWADDRTVATFFAIERALLLDAFRISGVAVQNRTPEQVRVFERFTSEIIPIKMARVHA